MNNIQIYNKNIGVECFFIRFINTTESYGIWLKFTLLKTNSGIYFRVWSICFDKMLPPKVSYMTYPINKISFDNNIIEWPDGFVDFRKESYGNTKNHSWDLTWKVEDDKPIKLLPNFLYSNTIPTTKLETPYPKICGAGEFKNNIFYNGEFNGMQGHNWGPKHSNKYVWCFGNSKDCIIEGFSTKLFQLQFTSLCIRYNKDYMFSDILSPFRIKSYWDREYFEWKIYPEKQVRISCFGNSNCSPDVYYLNPDKSKMLCKNDNLSKIYISLKDGNKVIEDCFTGALEFLK